MADLATALRRSHLPSVVGDVYRDGEAKPRGTRLQDFFAASGLDSTVSSVDNLDESNGTVAAVVALRDLGDGGAVGHYGEGRPLPAESEK